MVLLTDEWVLLPINDDITTVGGRLAGNAHCRILSQRQLIYLLHHHLHHRDHHPPTRGKSTTVMGACSQHAAIYAAAAM